MRVLVFGAGAIGSFLGAMLSARHEVTLIARKPHVEAIKKHGLKVEGLIEKNVCLEAYERIPSGNWDIAFITTKAYDTRNAAREIVKAMDAGTIVSMQNGLNNLEVIAQEVGQRNFSLCGCVTSIGVTFLEPGKVRLNGWGRTVLGGCEEGKKICEMLNEASIECEYSEDILKEIWVKGVVNSAINPLTALFKVKNGLLLQNPHLKEMLLSVALESQEIGRALGYIPKDIDCVALTLKVAEQTAENYSSMLQDIMKGRRTEIREINGHIVEMGARVGKEARLNKFLLNAILALESLRCP